MDISFIYTILIYGCITGGIVGLIKGFYTTGIQINHYLFVRRNSNLFDSTINLSVLDCLKNIAWHISINAAIGGLIVGLFPFSVVFIINRYGSVRNYLNCIWKN